MHIPEWIFAECKRLGFITNDSSPLKWDEHCNPAWVVYKLILADRKRRAVKPAIEVYQEQSVKSLLKECTALEDELDMWKKRALIAEENNRK